jgi:hypothetical protein
MKIGFYVSEKRGFLQAVSVNVHKVVLLLLLASPPQTPAVIWLTTFTHEQITK